MNELHYENTHGLDTVIKIEAERHNVPLKEAMHVFTQQTTEYGLFQGTLNTIDHIRQYQEVNFHGQTTPRHDHVRHTTNRMATLQVQPE